MMMMMAATSLKTARSRSPLDATVATVDTPVLVASDQTIAIRNKYRSVATVDTLVVVTSCMIKLKPQPRQSLQCHTPKMTLQNLSCKHDALLQSRLEPPEIMMPWYVRTWNYVLQKP